MKRDRITSIPTAQATVYYYPKTNAGFGHVAIDVRPSSNVGTEKTIDASPATYLSYADGYNKEAVATLYKATPIEIPLLPTRVEHAFYFTQLHGYHPSLSMTQVYQDYISECFQLRKEKVEQKNRPAIAIFRLMAKQYSNPPDEAAFVAELTKIDTSYSRDRVEIAANHLVSNETLHKKQAELMGKLTDICVKYQSKNFHSEYHLLNNNCAHIVKQALFHAGYIESEKPPKNRFAYTPTECAKLAITLGLKQVNEIQANPSQHTIAELIKAELHYLKLKIARQRMSLMQYSRNYRDSERITELTRLLEKFSNPQTWKNISTNGELAEYGNLLYLSSSNLTKRLLSYLRSANDHLDENKILYIQINQQLYPIKNEIQKQTDETGQQELRALNLRSTVLLLKSNESHRSTVLNDTFETLTKIATSQNKTHQQKPTWRQRLANAILGIVTLGMFYGVALGIHRRRNPNTLFFQPTNRSKKAVSQSQRNLEKVFGKADNLITNQVQTPSSTAQ